MIYEEANNGKCSVLNKTFKSCEKKKKKTKETDLEFTILFDEIHNALNEDLNFNGLNYYSTLKT